MITLLDETGSEAVPLGNKVVSFFVRTSSVEEGAALQVVLVKVKSPDIYVGVTDPGVWGQLAGIHAIIRPVLPSHDQR